MPFHYVSKFKIEAVALGEINPFMLNVFSYPYQLDESISNFRVVGWHFSFLFK